MFEIGKEYSSEDIRRITGGSKQAFLPVKVGKVVAARLRQDLNPHAPDVIVCDGSASARAAGRARRGARWRGRRSRFRSSCEPHRTDFAMPATTWWPLR